MPTLIDNLRAEAIKYRHLADRLDETANALARVTSDPTSSIHQLDTKFATTGLYPFDATTTEMSPATMITQPASRSKGYEGLTQRTAILKVLKDHGEQTTRQIWERLNTYGFNFKQVSYITALMPRLDGLVEKDVGTNKYRLTKAAQEQLPI